MREPSMSKEDANRSHPGSGSRIRQALKDLLDRARQGTDGLVDALGLRPRPAPQPVPVRSPLARRMGR